MERMMKLQDVLLKAMAKKITWWAAAEIIGVSDRTMRRVEGTAERARIFRADGPAQREGQQSASAAENVGGGAAVISGAIQRLQRAAFSREAAGKASNPAVAGLGFAAFRDLASAAKYDPNAVVRPSPFLRDPPGASQRLINPAVADLDLMYNPRQRRIPGRADLSGDVRISRWRRANRGRLPRCGCLN
jgi:hypothetical protein